jgi:hypothetical protein
MMIRRYRFAQPPAIVFDAFGIANVRHRSLFAREPAMTLLLALALAAPPASEFALVPPDAVAVATVDARMLWHSDLMAGLRTATTTRS